MSSDVLEPEHRLVALVALERALPLLDAVVPLRASGVGLHVELKPVMERQWAEATAAAPITREAGDRDAQRVMAAILENNTYLGDAAPGDRRAEIADALLQALHLVAERSRSRVKSDGTLVRLSFSAHTLREVLAELARAVPPGAAEHAGLADEAALRERVRAAGGDAAKLLELRADAAREGARHAQTLLTSSRG